MQIIITRDDIVAICPPPKTGPKRVVWDGYVAALTSLAGRDLFDEYEVNTPLRMIHALATMACETNLTVLWESGAYSADGIERVFGARHSAKIGRAEAVAIAALPVDRRTEVLFERVYGRGNPKKARELGNTQAGDGWRFRGMGLNQLTGRAAHENAARIIGCRVEVLANPVNCVHAFLIEWDGKDCNAWADRDDAVSIRKLINGGSLRASVSRINGLPDAIAAVSRAKRVITASDFETAPAGTPAGLAGPPASMAVSTESHAAAGVGVAGGWQMQTELSNAAANLAGTGQGFSAQAFALQIMASPGFWLAAMTIAGAGYWWLKRRARLYMHGV